MTTRPASGHVTALVIAGLLSPLLAHSFDEVSQRRQAADRAVVALDKSRKAVLGSEYLLISFSQDVPLGELRPIVARTGVRLTAVYLCADGGGVMAVYLDDDKQPWSRLSDPHDREGVAVQLSRAQEHTARLGGQARFRSHDRYCGVDVQGEYEQLTAFRSALRQPTYMVELTSSRMRLAAANVVQR